MDIERDLEFARKCVMVSTADIVTKTRVDETLKAIARQSVKSEDVADAIELFDGAIKYRKNQEEEEVKKHYGGKLPDFYLDLNRKEALAITALQAYQPWVSIDDEKPESGKHVLLCCEITSGKRYVCDGYYATSKSITSGYSGEWDCEYDEETDEYYLSEGCYEIIKNWDDCSSIAIKDFVTHWKPLPEPPKGE